VKRVTHITPRFWPQIDGLGDYARLLGGDLRQRFGFESAYIVGDPNWSNHASPAEFSVRAVQARAVDALLRELDAVESLVLHYVGYGYQTRGTPFWINRAVRRWKQERPLRRLVIVFHELWASGPPWKSEFYLGWIQRRLVEDLHELADGSVTSTPIMFEKLNAIRPGKTAFAPIPSCVTPPLPADSAARKDGVTLTVFGQEASRMLTVQSHSKLVQALHRAGVLEELRVIGKGATSGSSPSKDVAALSRLLPPEKLNVLGDQGATELATALAGGDLFLSYYPSAYLCKSSALTAAMACGCLPVLPELKNAAPLVANREILECDGGEASIERIIDLIKAGKIPELCRHARSWYEANASWFVTTDAVARFLQAS
jgi:hypothetical protein